MDRGDGSARECRDQVAAYALGALEEAERKRFMRHLASCIVCHDELAAFQQVVDLLPICVRSDPCRAGCGDTFWPRSAATPSDTAMPSDTVTASDTAAPAGRAHGGSYRGAFLVLRQPSARCLPRSRSPWVAWSSALRFAATITVNLT
jgi:anti-sigma factor RsiW